MFDAGEIYSLPDGRELMAAGDGVTFYGAGENEQDLLRYELDDNGRLLCAGRMTAWTEDDLRPQAIELAPHLSDPGERPECVVK